MLKRKRTIVLIAVLALILLCVCVALLVYIANEPEPIGKVSTASYTFDVRDNQIFADETVIFKADSIGAKLTATISPTRVYVLCDDVLYSMDADGGNQYKITTKCYNPGELAFSITDSETTDLRTLWYYNGYVYFIKYGTHSALYRFKVGTHDFEKICTDKVSAFIISEDGILYGYSKADNYGERQLTYQKELLE